MSVYSRVVLAKGTKIRDHVGHHVATIAADILAGQQVMPDDVEMVDGSKLVVGQMPPAALVEYLEGRRYEDQA